MGGSGQHQLQVKDTNKYFLLKKEQPHLHGHGQPLGRWRVHPGLQSGALVGQLEHGACLLQALVHVQLPPEGLLLLLQFPSDTPWAGDRLFFALRMEDSSTAFTSAC